MSCIQQYNKTLTYFYNSISFAVKNITLHSYNSSVVSEMSNTERRILENSSKFLCIIYIVSNIQYNYAAS